MSLLQKTVFSADIDLYGAPSADVHAAEKDEGYVKPEVITS